MANAQARRLRKTMIPQEVKLWVHLRSWRKRGFHFRRQSPRYGYIIDFVCLKHRLIVEVDGGQHNFGSHATHDRVRDASFSGEGFKVLRFWNSDVDQNLNEVLETIDRELQRSSPPTRSGFADHPPPSGEG